MLSKKNPSGFSRCPDVVATQASLLVVAAIAVTLPPRSAGADCPGFSGSGTRKRVVEVAPSQLAWAITGSPILASSLPLPADASARRMRPPASASSAPGMTAIDDHRRAPSCAAAWVSVGNGVNVKRPAGGPVQPAAAPELETGCSGEG